MSFTESQAEYADADALHLVESEAAQADVLDFGEFGADDADFEAYAGVWEDELTASEALEAKYADSKAADAPAWVVAHANAYGWEAANTFAVMEVVIGDKAYAEVWEIELADMKDEFDDVKVWEDELAKAKAVTASVDAVLLVLDAKYRKAMDGLLDRQRKRKELDRFSLKTIKKRKL